MGFKVNSSGQIAWWQVIKGVTYNWVNPLYFFIGGGAIFNNRIINIAPGFFIRFTNNILLFICLNMLFNYLNSSIINYKLKEQQKC